MDFTTCFQGTKPILMEGAIGERLKREFDIRFDDNVAMAGLIYDDKSREALNTIFKEYATIAEKYGLPFMVTTPTRRANKSRVCKSLYNEKIIEDNVAFLKTIRNNLKSDMFIGGLMGCMGDAYRATEVLSIEEAQKFHQWQVDLFMEAKVDFLFAGIMPALPEAIGMAIAMANTEIPYIISFMIRENGRLIDGTTIHDAIYEIDNSVTNKPICYMTNCVHPVNLRKALKCPYNKTDLVRLRFKGIQANTSTLSPEELDNSKDLKSSDSIELANDMMLLNKYINLKIFGGCCGTDNTHMEELAKRISGI